jgi:phytoene synthase
VDEAMLARGVVNDAWRRFMRAQVARARALYARAAKGVPYLTGFGSQRVVRLMATVYGGILDVIEARDFDVFSSRASVPFTRKLALAAGVLLTPNPPQPSLSSWGERRGEGLSS